MKTKYLTVTEQALDAALADKEGFASRRCLLVKAFQQQFGDVRVYAGPLSFSFQDGRSCVQHSGEALVADFDRRAYDKLRECLPAIVELSEEIEVPASQVALITA